MTPQSGRKAVPALAAPAASGYTGKAILHPGGRQTGPRCPDRTQGQIARIMTTPTTDGAGSALRVLFVEDDMIIQFSTAEMLQELGHAVTAASDAEEALRELEAGGFDLLFTDVSLPGRSGVELAKDARRLHPALRVIFASGYGDSALAGQGGEGAVILPKPYSMTSIEQAVRKAMEG